MAEALNQDRATAAVKIRTAVYPKRVTIELIPARGGAELEQWSLKKKPPTSARSSAASS